MSVEQLLSTKNALLLIKVGLELVFVFKMTLYIENTISTSTSVCPYPVVHQSVIPLGQKIAPNSVFSLYNIILFCHPVGARNLPAKRRLSSLKRNFFENKNKLTSQFWLNLEIETYNF